MKILRSKGQSYTVLENRPPNAELRLARGLTLKAEKLLAPEGYRGKGRVNPSELAQYVGEDYALILRQTISVLDKVIRKPRKLYQFDRQAYVDRSMLGAELWKLLCENYKAKIEALPKGEEAFDHFSKIWQWKVHPYARFPVSPASPDDDENAKYIAEQRAKFERDKSTRQRETTRADFNGRWHAALWREDEFGKPNYRTTAQAIWSHLFVQEIRISGEDRKRKSGEQLGLIKARGISASNSVSDPRNREAQSTSTWEANDENVYFSQDVAARIYGGVFDAERAGRLHPAWFGSILYEHFGDVLKRGNDESARKRLWALHNGVRKFYQKLAKSERFRRACREGDHLKLGNMLPRNRDGLLSVLKGRERNANISELIRIGKLVAHASDLPFDTAALTKAFQERMDYFVTSAGQSEIKRSEAFTRVWRTSVALSLGTLRGWVEPIAPETDFTGTAASAGVIANFREDLFLRQLPIIFGAKAFNFHGGKSRRDLFLPADPDMKKELLWAMLRLASEVRHRTNHFSTMRRMVDLVAGGILKEWRGDKKSNFGNRKGREVRPEVFTIFDELLSFDLALQAQTTADELNRLKTTSYVPEEKLEGLLEQLSPPANEAGITSPKFMSVLIHIRNLIRASKDSDEFLRPFSSLSFDNLSIKTEEASHFKVGVMRLLYGRGFVSWLANRKDDATFIHQAVSQVAEAKKRRIEAFHKDEKRLYVWAQSLADDVALSSAGTLEDVFRVLTAWSVADERMRHTYRARAEDHRERSGEVEEFKRDLFAYLFRLYLRENGLDWIFEVQNLRESDAEPVLLSSEDIRMPQEERKPWHSQFYAWLYLVPVDDISLLRHQFKKTSVLEGKGSGDAKLLDKLNDLDRLMGLYLAVQSAGFGGTEHEAGLRIGDLFYEDPEQFGEVYSDDMETHHMSLPGTRRGLSQILRFGHLAALEGIFEKHRISNEEVRAFTRLRSDDVAKRFEEKVQLHRRIIELSSQRKPETIELRTACDDYKQRAVWVAKYGFQIKAARLTEHAELHQLMMRVIGRLTDFTLMWERDRSYLFLGMLYLKLRHEAMTLEQRADRFQRIGIRLTDELKRRLFAGRQSSTRRSSITQEDANTGFLPLWHDELGLLLKGDEVELSLLDADDKVLFNRYFGKIEAENQKDVHVAGMRSRTGELLRPSSLGKTKRQIRNDFAHFNVLSRRNGRVNLSYLTNAVRSLLSYDRKLKNAVSKAVADILFDEGIVIAWSFEEDRLRRPTIRPKLETHLTMVRPRAGFNPQFKLPQVSVRFTSMVKALFDFDAGGYRAPVDQDGKTKARGEMRYPLALHEGFADAIPAEMFVVYPALPSKKVSAIRGRASSGRKTYTPH